MTMPQPDPFALDEVTLLTDSDWFRKKARLTAKVQGLLAVTQTMLADELRDARMVTPPGYDPRTHQLVKGEHLESCPYQYLDHPKHFQGGNAFTYRTLFWWGHHLACALLLEGTEVKLYKKRIVDRFHQIAGAGLELSLAPTLWEWKHGAGYTLPITHDRKAQIAAVLAERRFLKIMRCVPMTDPRVQQGQIAELSRETWRALLPIVAM